VVMAKTSVNIEDITDSSHRGSHFCSMTSGRS